MNPLVQFNASYYRYPASVSRGYWSRYPTDAGLPYDEAQQREKWLSFASAVSQTQFGKFVSGNLSDPCDQTLLRSCLDQHGVFAERFFIAGIRERISRHLAAPSLDLPNLKNLLSIAWGQDMTGSERSLIVFWCAETIFDQQLLASLDDQGVSAGVHAWYDEASRDTKCQICHRGYRVVDLPDWIYHGSNGQRHCCFQCKIIDRPTKERLHDLIPAFTRACGFVPRSDASPINHSFTSRLPQDDWAQVIKRFAAMGGVEYVKKKFGSWFIALASSGALPDGVQATSRGIRCIAADGHTCHSLDEQVIDNWLYAHGIPHEREPKYPPHPKHNPGGLRRADWSVGDMYIEYFGLVGDSAYDKKIDEKIALACSVNIPLVALYPADIGRLDQAMPHLP